MKKIALFLAIFSVYLQSACTQQAAVAQNAEDESSEVFDERKNKLSKRMGYSYGKSSIVKELFEDAVEKDNTLKTLMEAMTQLDKSKVEALKPYQKYTQNNSAYWEDVTLYINGIQDSTLRKQTRAFFKTSQKNYMQSIEAHESELEKLQASTLQLQDQKSLLKLMLTLQMLQTYNQNELPHLNTLQKLNQDYEQQLKEIKAFLKEEK